MKIAFFFFVLLSLDVFGALTESQIPRQSRRHFVEEGVFSGGSPQSANLEGIRFSPHKGAGFERWVIDFSDAQSRTIGKIAPKFQIRYITPTQIETSDGSQLSLLPGKFVLSLQNVHSYLEPSHLKKLVRKSKLVKDIVVYPPIENNDLAIEIILKDHVLFEPHQPTEREGRLVLDLKRRE